MSRNVSLLNSVFASDAETVVPISPMVGIPYRNRNLTSGKAGQGWPFSTVVDSADFNELMFRMTGLIDYVEKTGGIIWSPLTDYPVGAFVRDEQMIFWQATKASGPNNGGSQIPEDGSQYWKVAEIIRIQDSDSIALSIVNQVLTATLRLASASALSVGTDGVRVALHSSDTNAIKIVDGGLFADAAPFEAIPYMQQQTVFFDGTGVVCCGDWNIGEWEDSNEWPLIWDHGDLSVEKTVGFPDWTKEPVEVKKLPFTAPESGFFYVFNNTNSIIYISINDLLADVYNKNLGDDGNYGNASFMASEGDKLWVVESQSIILGYDVTIFFVPMIGSEGKVSTTIIDCGEWNNLAKLTPSINN